MTSVAKVVPITPFLLGIQVLIKCLQLPRRGTPSGRESPASTRDSPTKQFFVARTCCMRCQYRFQEIAPILPPLVICCWIAARWPGLNATKCASVLFILVVADKWGHSKNKQKKSQNNCNKVMADKWANAKSNQNNSSKHLQKSLKIGSGTIPGALWGGSGTSLAPGRPRARKGHQKAAKY